MCSTFKTKMADGVDEVGEKAVTSNGVSDEKQSNEDGISALERRYSLQEANEIGKEVLQSIRSSLMPKVGSGLIEDPYIKAWKYMEESNVLLLLEVLLTKLVFEKPDVPVQFMADEIQSMKGKDLSSYQAYQEETTQK